MKLEHQIIADEIKRILVEKACEDDLPLDINDLDMDNLFEEAVKKSLELHREDIMTERLDNYLYGTFEERKKMYKILMKESTLIHEMIDHVDGIIPLAYCEYSLTVENLLTLIGEI